ncbi:MAG: acyltransferase family protein [Nocardioidaceae bacterium]
MPTMPRTAGYRPWLDGLRGVAVLLVVAEHVGQVGSLRVPEGLGEVGVGIFFGLSGYLITGLLVDERTAAGRVSLRRFYVRRVARLLPALLVMLTLCNLAYLALGRHGILRGSLYALSYVANYATILSGNYVPGYGQTWSLAVEEHFYLVWPLALVAVLGRGRGQDLHRLLRWTLVACGVALAWRCFLVLGTTAPDLLMYHGSLERADALLYGCAAALAVRTGWRPGRWLGWCGAVILCVVVLLTDHGPFGMTLVQAAIGVASAALAVSLDHHTGSQRRVLSARPLVWFGLVSYGIYLWHWPLLSMARTVGADTTLGALVVGFAITPAVAALSYYLVERPARVAIRRRAEAALAASDPGVRAGSTR